MHNLLVILLTIFSLNCSQDDHSQPSGNTIRAYRDPLGNARGPFTGQLEGDLFINGKHEITYFELADVALFEGDIVLPKPKGEASDVGMGLAHAWTSTRWPGATIPYTITPGLPNRDRILKAIRHWEENTPMRFVERQDEADFVTFQAGDNHCWSNVGRVGGEQFITLEENCGMGVILHEIGHAVGLFHEQNRPDRDDFVKVHWANIDQRYHSQFKLSGSKAQAVGAYDDKSRMHYHSTAFSINGEPTLTKLDGSLLHTNSSTLSAGDIATVRSMYADIIDQNQPSSEDVLLADVLALNNADTENCDLQASATKPSDRRGNFASQVLSPSGQVAFVLNSKLSAETNAAIIRSSLPFLLADCR